MKETYSDGYKEQALVKVYNRGAKTVREVADDLNVNYHTLKNWMKTASPLHKSGPSGGEKRPGDWSLSERLRALQESHALKGEALHAWCRERGLYAHHLQQWREAFCREDQAPAEAAALRALKADKQRLERELARKDKALAEAAALLVLQKKFQALWEDGDV